MRFEQRKNFEGGVFLLLFCLTIPAANWMIGHVGESCSANSPCLVPVAPGIMAPSGVLMIGAALVLLSLPLIAYLRRRDQRLGLTAA